MKEEASVASRDMSCRPRTTGFFSEVKIVDVGIEKLLIKEFGHHIRSILSPLNLMELEIAASESILNPEVGNSEMSYPTKSTAPADSYGRRGIRVDLQADGQAKVKA